VKAAVLETIPGELVIDDLEVRAPAAHEVLIRTVASGLCHSDLHFLEGLYQCPVPAVLGHECAGIVEAVGADVTYVRPGDHVITCISGFCGTCEYCMRGKAHLCDQRALQPDPAQPRLTRGGEVVNQFFGLAGFSEQLLVHEHYVVKIRADMPLDRAALLGCGVTTGVGAVINTARVRPGETVAVIGCGGIGLNAVQAAAITGAGRVIAVDRVASKLDLAARLGATDLVDASAVDPVLAVLELTGGGVDHAFEAIGLTTTAQQAFAMLKSGGTATVIGMIPLGQKVEVDGFQLLMEKRLQGSRMGSNRFRLDMAQYIEWYLAGKLKLDELVSATMPIERINEGFAAMRGGELARQLVVFE